MFWQLHKLKVLPGSMQCKYDDHVNACVGAAYEKATWENFQSHIRRPEFRWTVTHSDAHPGNLVWDPNTKSIVMVDMELVGISNPMGDVATFLTVRSTP